MEEKRVEVERSASWTENNSICAAIEGTGGLKYDVSESDYFIFYSFRHFEPVECFEDRTDVMMFGRF